MKDVEESPFEPVPLHLRNPATNLMKDIGYGKDYAYAHDCQFLTTNMETFPKRLRGRKYYVPGDLGLEKDIKRRIDWWKTLKKKIKEREIKKKNTEPSKSNS